MSRELFKDKEVWDGVEVRLLRAIAQAMIFKYKLHNYEGQYNFKKSRVSFFLPADGGMWGRILTSSKDQSISYTGMLGDMVYER